ncbi:hypothetical protein SDC9_193330 [bioreactor metagenome]|uniref:Uncharacterized protein n=1 Tax=bioreactor metagenome TaxID=1076179 RepID=A0A645I5T3_9ZZZZ
MGQRVGDFAHLGFHAGVADHRNTAPVDYGAAHIDHIPAVAEGDLTRGIERFGNFFGGYRFAGQCGFLHFH